MAENKKTIDLTSEVVQAQLFEEYLAKLMEWLFVNNSTLKRPTPQEQDHMQLSAKKELEAKYSQAGMKFAE